MKGREFSPGNNDGMQINVVKNAKRNLVFGTVNKIILLILPFIKRLVIQTFSDPSIWGSAHCFNL